MNGALTIFTGYRLHIAHFNLTFTVPIVASFLKDGIIIDERKYFFLEADTVECVARLRRPNLSILIAAYKCFYKSWL